MLEAFSPITPSGIEKYIKIYVCKRNLEFDHFYRASVHALSIIKAAAMRHSFYNILQV